MDNKLKAFIQIERQPQPKRPVEERVRDWKEVYLPFPEETLHRQAARCMDCGIPFCHQGCPLGNLIPDWNELVYRNNWYEAIERLHATNNFPEFTGTLCPAPCEASCVLSINSDAVTIKQIENTIIERAFEEGWVKPNPPKVRSGKKIAVIGSGPAGLAAAQQLNRAGHWVTVFERDDRIGGLLRYGIPEFKMEKRLLNRRLEIMEAEEITFQANCDAGVNPTVEELRRDFDAIVLAVGATQPRDLPVPGRELEGIHFAMDYLPLQNRRLEGDDIPEDKFISAKDKHVVIVGGGDTGSDCMGTAHRQGAVEVTQLQRWPAPPTERTFDNPWPLWPQVFTVSSSQEEGGVRDFAVWTTGFRGSNGKVEALQAFRVTVNRDENGRPEPQRIPDSEFEIKADLVLLAMGYSGPEAGGITGKLGLELTERGSIATDKKTRMTSVPGVFAAGDAARGQSLIVWAIAEGRQAAHHVDRYLMGSTNLPTPL